MLELLQLRRRVKQVDVVLEHLQRRRHENDTDQNPKPDEKKHGSRKDSAGSGPPCVPWWQARVRSGVSGSPRSLVFGWGRVYGEESGDGGGRQRLRRRLGLRWCL